MIPRRCAPRFLSLLAGALCALHAEPLATKGVIRLPVTDRQDIRFTILSVNGEPFKRWVLDIARDKQGFLWLATTHGLYRYDGYSLRNYRHDRDDPNTLSDDTVRCVFSDRSGNLWVGTNSGGLNKLDPARDSFIHYRHKDGDPRGISGNLIPQVFQDRSGNLWIATDGGLDRLNPATGEFTHYRHDPKNSASLTANGINSIYQDRNGDIWVGTQRGLNRIERGSGAIARFLHDPANPRSLGHDYVNSIREDRAGTLWVAAGNQLDAFDRRLGEFRHYSFHAVLPGAQAVAGVTGMVEDTDGILWLSTANSGVVRFDRERRQFTRYLSDPFNPNALVDNSVDTLFHDPEGLIWACTKSGISRFFARKRGFVRYHREHDNPDSLRDNVIWSLHEDSQGFLWIGTRLGLHRLDRRTGRLAVFRNDAANRNSLSYDTVSSIREDRNGNLWAGTYGGGLNRLDRATARWSAFRRSDRPGSLSSDRILCLMFDRNGYLWVGTGDAGMNRLDLRTRQFKTWRALPDDPNSLPDDNVKAIVQDRQGLIWIATNAGLSRFDPATERFTRYRSTSQPGSLSSDIVASIHEDRQGNLWIGCRNGLNRMDRARGTFTRITEKDGLPDDSVEAILEGEEGELWLATRFGLSRFDPRTNSFVNYTETDGLSGNNMNPYGSQAACVTRTGEMVFGSSEGVTLFRPEEVVTNPWVPPVVFTDFLLSGSSLRPGDRSFFQRPIWATDALTLHNRHRIFSLEFSALSYAAPDKNRYRFRLEPFEQRWNQGDSKRRLATYTNLPAGKYVFRVQASNNAGVWNERGAELAITVLPPWWATNWFQGMAVLCLAAAVIGIHQLRVRHLKLAAAALEREVAARTSELEVARDAAESANRAKSAFLAAMSHELRTPLNAILGFSTLLREGEATESQRKDIEIIRSSGEHLLALINDLLDSAKIEAGRNVLQPAACDPASIVREVAGMMRAHLDAKGLALRVETPSNVGWVLADAARLRQILINLLGNAVRYTEHGSVTLRFEEKPGEQPGQLLLTFEVQDTGIGIAPEDRERIFEPFVQVGRYAWRRGTGLGLTITRQLAGLMNGTIEVASTPGKGSCFRVEIPVERAHEPMEKFVPARPERIVGLQEGQPEYRILIVDNERENWLLLQRLLQKTGFAVQVAENGADGVDAFLRWRPHFIWMDLHMPVMNGLEATGRIRSLQDGKDVIIVAVTASAFREQRDEVLAAGFNDLVLKPYRLVDVFDCMARHLGVRYRREAASSSHTASMASAADSG